jgi:hypothetical protein
LKANPRSPFEIFSAPVRYVVPLYQRPYVWNLEDQWEPLWDDVRNVADQVLEADSPVAAAEVPPHFLGALVLDQQRGPTGHLDVRHIIDGQQRLTTLQLLLDAAQAIVESHGSPADAVALSTLTRNNAAVSTGPEDIFKVWPTNYDRAAFAAAMEGADRPVELRDHRVAMAHDFFRDAIEEWAEVDGDPDKVLSRLAALTTSLLRHLRVVVIDLEEGDNAQVIFETLNDRGTPLLAADLVKNRVFQTAQAEGVDVEKLYEDKWRPFDSSHWRRTINRGRLRRPRIDVFLYYWLAMKKQRLIAEDRLFTEFDSLLKAEPDVMPVVDDFVQRAEVYESLETFPPQSFEGTFTYRVLDTLDANLFGPVLLWIFGWDEDQLPTVQRELALRSLESWLVRRTVTRMTTKAYNRLMSELLQLLDRSGPASAGDAMRDFLATADADTERWPTDAEVTRALVEEPLYTQLKRARLRMILEALEDSMRSPRSEEEHCRRNLTIEHVMPQGWREHWPLESEDEPRELKAARRDRHLHTIGNLTLVTNRMNPSLSNRPWRDTTAIERGLGDEGKRSLLNQHTVLHLNREIIDGWPHAWTEEAIDHRAQRLVQRFLNVWPGPDQISV